MGLLQRFRVLLDPAAGHMILAAGVAGACPAAIDQRIAARRFAGTD